MFFWACRDSAGPAQILLTPLSHSCSTDNRIVDVSALVLQITPPTRPLPTYSLHLLQHSVFDFDVFKNSFDDHVSFFEAAVVQVARQVGQDGVSLKRCDALLFGFVIEPGYK